MSKNIQGVRIGNSVSLSIDGKLHKKLCADAKEADELFKAVIKAKDKPTDANIKALRILINERTRRIIEAGLEADIDTGEAYLAGFNTPLPDTLLAVIKEYHENGYPLDAIINFWKLLMINPDIRVRKTLFDFITAHDFVLTDKGYMVVYKAVYHKGEEGVVVEKLDTTLTEFISNQYLHIKSKWKCSPNKYVAYKNAEGVLAITKLETAEGWNEKNEGIEVLGKVGDLYAALVIADNKDADTEVEVAEKPVLYTDMYSRTMTIQLGKPANQERKLCDADPATDCSQGLHVGATSYVNRFANKDCTILACFVNPANVVAVPNYDHSKMRVDEYFPFAVADYDLNTQKIDIIEQKYFEDDYCTYEVAELEKQIALVQAGELPIASAKKAEAENRPMAELMKMLESRIFDINK